MTLRARFVAIAVVALGLTSFGSALATEAPATTATESDSGADPARDQLLSDGRAVYESICSGCHQPDGRGLEGTFPPLLDNPHVADSDYVQQVVTDGLEGEITVDGVTYNGKMPAFPLSDDELAAVTVYVQEGLGASGPVSTTLPGAATAAPKGLPGSSILAYTVAFGLFAFAAAAVLGSVFAARRLRGTFTTLQVWLKAGLIFTYFVIATVFIPSMVVEAGFLAQPPSVYEDVFSGKSWGVIRDLMGSGVWLVAVGFGFWALRRAQRQNLI